MIDWIKYVDKFNQNDRELHPQMIPNSQAKKWLADEIPKFECSDSVIEETYYFRWWTFRKHIKETPAGQIISEFLPPVSWAGAYNSINAAMSHHLSEARWLKNGVPLVREYLDFWLIGPGDETSYSSWMIDAAYQYALTTNDQAYVVSRLPYFLDFYNKIYESNHAFDGLFWSDDDRDAMEFSISGSGLRPTLNSYMYANAFALAQIAKWAEDISLSNKYEAIAKGLKQKICTHLWDEVDTFFKVIPQQEKDDVLTQVDFKDILSEHNVREAIGFIPWSFLIPDEQHDVAWKFLKDACYFKADYGPTTAERKHPRFMEDSSHECLWNGPSWPFSTTQVLNGVIKTLQAGRNRWIDKADFLELIQIYANSHYRELEDGTKINWIDENLDPDSGIWLSRDRLESWGWRADKGGYERGKNYNHSAYCDQIIRGICGVCMDDENQLIIDPLLPDQVWSYFLLTDLPVRNRLVTIGYDADGSRYQKGKGLWVEIDGEIVARVDTIGRLSVSF